MNIKLVMTVLGMMMPAAMMILGFLLIQNPPKRKAKLAYRSRWAEKSKETWQYAHLVLGKVWFGLGTVLAVISAIVLVVAQIGNEVSIRTITSALATVQFTLWLVTPVPVELLLRVNFDKHGQRKARRR